ncbi:MAG: DUF72 domain-containing protein [Thermoanaerobaculum sp.]|nr:DUF72 domain-containing protein [Thermoanaerobaculum sp.]MDW7967902.1 DUF72 domain-containing protein [Thermoanaerobaculum sp.]
MAVFVGLSGFSYPSWRGAFYPQELPPRQFLQFYSQHFVAVELNVTFYRWPRASTLRRWRHQVPQGFRFAVKLHRSITHQQRLRAGRGELERLGELVAELQPAVVLAQLPPSLPFDASLLLDFVAALPQPFPPLVWEGRHRSFCSTEAVAWFAQQGWSLVVADSGGRYPTLWEVTGTPLYLRFHGPGPGYASAYSDQELSQFVDWLCQVSPQAGDTYAFFNNTAGVFALENARSFARLLALRGLAPQCSAA